VIPRDNDEPEYLDLDGDGVPDAVRTTERIDYEVGGAEVVETVRELDREIGDDGRPGEIEWSDTVTVDVDHDGSTDAIEVLEVEVRPDARDEG
jgi:hypothetical protein